MNAPPKCEGAGVEDAPVIAHDTIHRFVVRQADAGILGAVDGGKLLEWVDKVAYAVAANWSGRYCVTAYVGNIHLQRPIAVGEVVELHAELIYTGRTSMHILVSVFASDPTRIRPEHSAECLTVFVANDDSGASTAVRAFQPTTLAGLERHRQARARLPLRRRIEELMHDQHYTDEGTAPSALMRFLAAPSDVNWGGKVHGGRTMGWINESAHLCGADWAAQHPIASYIAGIRFYRPVNIGDTVEITARLLHTGPHSMHIGVHVTTTVTGCRTSFLAAHGMTVFVVLDADGKAAPVPQWRPLTSEDRRLDAFAQQLIALRQCVTPFPPTSSRRLY